MNTETLENSITISTPITIPKPHIDIFTSPRPPKFKTKKPYSNLYIKTNVNKSIP